MASLIFDSAKSDIFKGVHNLSTITMKVMLVKNTFTPTGSERMVSDITSPTNYEVSGTGYSRVTLTSVTVTIDSTNHKVVLDAADATWAALNVGTVGGLIIFRDRGGADSANEVLFYDDVTDQNATGGAYTIVWNANGIYRW